MAALEAIQSEVDIVAALEAIQSEVDIAKSLNVGRLELREFSAADKTVYKIIGGDLLGGFVNTLLGMTSRA